MCGWTWNGYIRMLNYFYELLLVFTGWIILTQIAYISLSCENVKCCWFSCSINLKTSQTLIWWRSPCCCDIQSWWKYFCWTRLQLDLKTYLYTYIFSWIINMCLLHTCIFFRRTPRSREMVAEQSMFATFVYRYWFCRRRHRTILGRDGSMDPSPRRW